MWHPIVRGKRSWNGALSKEIKIIPIHECFQSKQRCVEAVRFWDSGGNGQLQVTCSVIRLHFHVIQQTTSEKMASGGISNKLGIQDVDVQGKRVFIR